MNRQHYEHMVEEVKYLIIMLAVIQEKQNSTNDTTHTNHMTRNEAHYLKDEIATMAGRRDRKKRLVKWGAMVALGY